MPNQKNPVVRKPNWRKWLNIPELPIWKAVALSLDIDPDKARYTYNWKAEAHLTDESQEFKDRIEIAAAHVGRNPALTGEPADAFHQGELAVKLAEFAGWALSLHWKLPVTLKRMGKKFAEEKAGRAVSHVSPRQHDTEENLGTKGRNSYLLIIAALLKAQNIDFHRPTKAAGQVECLVGLVGGGIKKRAIENHLRELRKFLDERKP